MLIITFHRFPIGPYQIYILDEILKVIKFDETRKILEFTDGTKLFGIMKCMLVPPKDNYPYLSHNFGDQEKPYRFQTCCLRIYYFSYMLNETIIVKN